MNLLDQMRSLLGPAKIPTVILDGSGVAIGIKFRGVEIPLGGLSADDLRTIGFVEANASNQLVKNGVVISGTPVVANQAALPDVSTYSGFTYRVANQGLYGIDYQSNGTVWSPVGGSALLHMDTSFMAGTITCPAATFTSATATSINSGTDIRLTSAGAHGLTSALAVGKKIYVSAGTNWTVGFYTIKTIAVDTSGLVIDLEEPFVASMGVPTIALAGTDIPILSKTIPVLRAKTSLHFNADVLSDTVTASNRITKMVWGGTQFMSQQMTSTSSISNPLSFRVNNLTTATQRSSNASGCTGYAVSGTTAPATGTVDTTAETTLVINANLSVANVPYEMTHYEIYIRG